MTEEALQTKRAAGRPVGSGAGRTAVLSPVRVTPEQRATYEAVGGAEWLRGELDRAREMLERVTPPQK